MSPFDMITNPLWAHAEAIGDFGDREEVFTVRYWWEWKGRISRPGPG